MYQANVRTEHQKAQRFSILTLFKTTLPTVVVSLIFTLASVNTLQAREVVFPAGMSANDFRYKYPFELLVLALSKVSEEKPKYHVRQSTFHMNLSREKLQLKHGALLDVISRPSSVDNSREFNAVPFPIRKGILGIRIPITTEICSSHLNNQLSEPAVRTLSMGQGEDWIDTEILRYNNYNVVTSNDYHSLFTMLAIGRFQLFPRGVYEPWEELNTRKDSHPSLVVNDSVAFYYLFPDLFHTRLGDDELAEDILNGLKKAQADGSFDQLFTKYFGAVLEQAGLDKRKIFYLENPFISVTEELIDSSHWWLPHPRLN